MTALRRQMDQDMVVRGMADKTREAYLGAVTGLVRFYRRPPDQIADQNIQTYLLYLMQERKRSWSTCNIAVQGLRFLYHVTLKRDATTFSIPRAKPPMRLPEILSREEVHRILGVVVNPKHHALLATAYAAGLRVSELVHLRVRDLDAARMTIRVEQGKGAKDRYTLLSACLLDELRGYWRQQRPRPWLFPGERPDRPIDITGVQRVYAMAKLRAGVMKRGGIHGLRHAFATHLLEAGVDVHTIQRLMGHRSITTTTRYWHLTPVALTTHAARLDLLHVPASVLPPA